MKKLSDILIKSQGKRKQNFFRLVSRDLNGEVQDYCAIGAVGCALGFIKKKAKKPKNFDTGQLIIKTFTKLGIDVRRDFVVKCPFCDYKDRYIGWVIVHLNDDHQQTFEQIGNFLKGLGL